MLQQPLRHLNFIVTGALRSGSYILADAVNNAPRSVCHDAIISADEAGREAAHETYFGRSPHMPRWGDRLPSLERYLEEVVFPNACHGESAAGVWLPYHTLERHVLLSAVQRWDRRGDFAVVHVERNPVTCYISRKQAETRQRMEEMGVPTSQAWSTPRFAESLREQMAIAADLDDLVRTVREQESTRRRIQQLGLGQVLTVSYVDLALDWYTTTELVFEFLELPMEAVKPPGLRRLHHQSLSDRLSNWNDLYRTAPGDIRQFMDLAKKECV